MLSVYSFVALMYSCGKFFSQHAAPIAKGTFPTAHGAPYPGQPMSGPGGADYTHAALSFFDGAAKADGYWLFEPADPKPVSADVVVFLHGYGAYNPMCYGKWIKHLVAKGNIVIYPRYQTNIMWPRPDAFPENAATGIKQALEVLRKEGHVHPRTDRVAYFAHSYGGVIATNLGCNWQKFGIPKPAAMLLAEPGSGPLKGARLANYANLPPDMNLNIIVGEDDYVVGAEFGVLVFKTAINTPNRNLLIQRRAGNGQNYVSASHSEPYAYDLDFDSGVRNYTAKRVLSVSKLDVVDFFCYWKLGDAILEYTRHGRCGDIAFGNTPQQRFMGYWGDGTPVRELEVVMPQQADSLVLVRG